MERMFFLHLLSFYVFSLVNHRKIYFCKHRKTFTCKFFRVWKNSSFFSRFWYNGNSKNEGKAIRCCSKSVSRCKQNFSSTRKCPRINELSIRDKRTSNKNLFTICCWERKNIEMNFWARKVVQKFTNYFQNWWLLWKRFPCACNVCSSDTIFNGFVDTHADRRSDSSSNNSSNSRAIFGANSTTHTAANAEPDSQPLTKPSVSNRNTDPESNNRFVQWLLIYLLMCLFRSTNADAERRAISSPIYGSVSWSHYGSISDSVSSAIIGADRYSFNFSDHRFVYW